MPQIFTIDTTPLLNAIRNRQESVKHEVHYRGQPLSPEAQAEVDARLNGVLDVMVKDLMVQLAQGKRIIRPGRDHGEA